MAVKFNYVAKKIHQAYSSPRAALKYIRYLIFKPLGDFNYKKFIILTRSRTGSNLLVTYLNSHPNIFSRYEIFSRLNGKDYRVLLNDVFRKQPYYIKAAGFKIFYYHPIDGDGTDLWDSLRKMDDLYVIHLRRRNILRVIISQIIASESNLWSAINNSKIEEANKKTIYLDPNELITEIKRTEHMVAKGEDTFRAHNKLELYYEDLVESPQKEFSKIMQFLELPNIIPVTNLEKQNKELISELVENYKELTEVLANTKWSSYLKE